MFRNVRNKPDHIKKKISFTVSLVATLLIAFVWVSLLQFDPVSSRETQRAAVSDGPVKALIADFGSLFSGRGNEEVPASQIFVDNEAAEKSSIEKEIYFDPDRDPGEFDGAVYVDHPRFNE